DVVYSLRIFALERGEQLKAEARRMIEAAVERQVQTFLADTDDPEQFDRGGLREALTLQYLVSVEAFLDTSATPDRDDLVRAALTEAEATFERKIEYLSEFGKKIGVPEVDVQVLSQVMLTVLDEKWKDHLYDLDLLRNAIQYRAYGQKDPLIEYKKEAFEMFEDLMRDIQSTFTERFLKIQVTAEPAPRRMAPPPPPPPPTGGADDFFMGGAPQVAAPPAPAAVSSSLGRLGQPDSSVPEVGRNDPCPCGSGKKYKKCHGAGR